MRINYKQKRTYLKIVYYGSGLSGKTTNLEQIFNNLMAGQKITEVIKQADTHGDRTIYFDFMSVQSEKVGGFAVELSLFTVPGQAHYFETRRKVLSGVDGVVFVAGSQTELRESNITTLGEMRKYLSDYQIDAQTIPLVLQFNKRDLPDIMPVDKMYADLTRGTGEPFTESVASTGDGVMKTFSLIEKLTIDANRVKPIPVFS